MLRFVPLTMILVMTWLAADPAFSRDPEPIIGRASVIDGDTIEIHGLRIRLWGIDAPESRQDCYENGEAWRCGQRAAQALDEWIGQHTVGCLEFYRDRWQRIIAYCRVGTEDMGGWLVRNGWALDWDRFSGGFYEGLERQAEQEGRGMWQGEFDKPWEWRRR